MVEKEKEEEIDENQEVNSPNKQHHFEKKNQNNNIHQEPCTKTSYPSAFGKAVSLSMLLKLGIISPGKATMSIEYIVSSAAMTKKLLLMLRFRAKSLLETCWRMARSNRRRRKRYSVVQVLGRLAARKSSIPTRSRDAAGLRWNTTARSLIFTRRSTIKNASSKNAKKMCPAKVN